MTNALSGVFEWLFPSRVHRSSVPPLEAGYRPNTKLDDARDLFTWSGEEPDAVVSSGESIFVGVGRRLDQVTMSGRRATVASFEGTIDGMAVAGDGSLVVAVRGKGLSTLDPGTGKSELMCDASSVTTCVTDVLPLEDGSVLVAVGSAEHSADEWVQCLISRRRTGSLVRVADGHATVLLTGLPWPAGLAATDSGEFLLSLSHAHVVERRTLADPGQGTVFLSNMPGYPGRIAPAAMHGWWVAFPYMRNTAVELILSEPEFLADMVATIEPEAWMAPQLRSENPIREPLQTAQRRVFNEVKPWAPPKSYGLIAKVDPDGRVAMSAHSRPDGARHGVTGVAAIDPTRLALVCRGQRTLVILEGV